MCVSKFRYDLLNKFASLDLFFGPHLEDFICPQFFLNNSGEKIINELIAIIFDYF